MVKGVLGFQYPSNPSGRWMVEVGNPYIFEDGSFDAMKALGKSWVGGGDGWEHGISQSADQILLC